MRSLLAEERMEELEKCNKEEKRAEKIMFSFWQPPKDHKRGNTSRRAVLGLCGNHANQIFTCVIPTLTSLDTDEEPLIISPVPFRKLDPPLKNPVRSMLRASSKERSLMGPPLADKPAKKCS